MVQWYFSLIRQLESLSDLFDGDQDPWRLQKHVWCSKQAKCHSAEETGRNIQLIDFDWAWFYVCSLHQHNIGYTADGFYRSDDPTNSVKALKESGRNIQRYLYACKNYTWPDLSQVLNARDRSACCCVIWCTTGQSRLNHSRVHACGTFCKTSWPGRRALKSSFVLTTRARMTLDCRLVGSDVKLLTLTMCQWLCYSVNVWHGECDEPDGGKHGILLWRMIVNWCYRFPVVIDQTCV